MNDNRTNTDLVRPQVALIGFEFTLDAYVVLNRRCRLVKQFLREKALYFDITSDRDNLEIGALSHPRIPLYGSFYGPDFLSNIGKRIIQGPSDVVV